jgi:hypothetical protein
MSIMSFVAHTPVLLLVACAAGSDNVAKSANVTLAPSASEGIRLTTVSTTPEPNSKNCGDSLCGKMKDKSHSEMWIPIAAIAGVVGTGVAAGGVAAGVLAAQQKKKSAGKGAASSTAAAAPEILQDAVTTTSGVLANAFLAGQTTSNLISQKMAAPPQLAAKRSGAAYTENGLVVRAASSQPAPGEATPAEAGSATAGWIVVFILALGACVALLLCTLVFMIRSRKKIKACARHLFPTEAEGDADDSTDMSASSRASSMDPGSQHIPRAALSRAGPAPRRMSAVNGSDVEDAPLLPEGAALPKFWTWLKEW